MALLLTIIIWKIAAGGCGETDEITPPLTADSRLKKIVPDPFFDDMVSISGGTFTMGDNFDEGLEDEKPIHYVTLSDYYIGKYEVTQAQWKTIMGNNPSRFNTCSKCPVENVSWNDVQKFLKKLNKKTDKNYRLPTESEWEYAARERGKKVRFGNGKEIANPNEINFVGTVIEPYSVAGKNRGKTLPVGSFSPNAIGLYDMSGNVWEWCNDWYGGYSPASVVNPKGPISGSKRVMRGGSWYEDPQACRIANRYYFKPQERLSTGGFRLCLTQM